jgi:hypothetical protein
VIESIAQEDINLLAALYMDDDQTFIDIQDPLSIMAQIEKDTMYWDEAMRQEDASQFLDAAIKEVETHSKMKHWVFIPINEVPLHT